MRIILHYIFKYKAFLLGLAFTYLLMRILEYVNLIRINPKETVENIFVFLVYAMIVSLLFVSYFKQGRKLIHLLIGFVLVCIAMAILGIFTSHLRDNPILVLVSVLFWIGGFYAIFPSFFVKYRLVIWIVYGLVSSYFLYVRLFSDSFDMYLMHKTIALSAFLIPIPFFVTLWIYEQWKWTRQLQHQNTQAELALLKTQINPHFFFNTLNNLYALSLDNHPQTPTVILKLSEMMRYTIYEGKKEHVALQAEIDYLKSYIELQKIRYHHPLQIDFTIPQTIPSLEIAPLLFIILVENAFKHGVEKLRDEAYLKIHLQIPSDDTVIFELENNYDITEKQNMSGIGLENLKRRLMLLYPNAHKLMIQQQNGIYQTYLKISGL